MPVQERTMPKEEIARRGKEIYQSRIRPILEDGNKGRFVAIDVLSGDYQMADEIVPAAKPILDRNPGAQVWLLRIGCAGIHNFRPGRPVPFSLRNLHVSRKG